MNIIWAEAQYPTCIVTPALRLGLRKKYGGL